MDNVFSQPTIDPPEVPNDFEATAGSSRVDFAKALFELLKKAKILGITEPNPQPYDINTLISRIEALEQKKVPKMRSVLKDGVSGATLTVAFQDIGTADYFVNVEAVTPDADINTVTWAVVENSKKSNEVKIRIDGNAATYKLVITIVENVGG